MLAADATPTNKKPVVSDTLNKSFKQSILWQSLQVNSHGPFTHKNTLNWSYRSQPSQVHYGCSLDFEIKNILRYSALNVHQVVE